MAIGKVEEAHLDKDKLIIKLGEHIIFQNQQEITENFEKSKEYLQKNDEIKITVMMNTGVEEHTVYGCDLTEEYVEINGHYTT
jgi:glutamate N-acetyltransferase/amino-acid N-acetyltransferase